MTLTAVKSEVHAERLKGSELKKRGGRMRTSGWGGEGSGRRREDLHAFRTVSRDKILRCINVLVVVIIL